MAKEKKEEQKGEVNTTAAASQVTQTPASQPSQALTPIAGYDPSRLQALVQALPADIQTGVQRLFAVMNPKKEGVEDGIDMMIEPTVIKVYQPVSSKDIPPAAKLGDLYTDSGEVLPQPFSFTPFYMYQTRAKFDNDDKSNSCFSEDREYGRHGRACATCPDKGEACADVLNVIAFGRDFSRVYKIAFSKSSMWQGGVKLQKFVKTTEKIWERWYALTSMEGKRAGNQPGKFYKFDVNLSQKDGLVDKNAYPICQICSAVLKEQRTTEKAESAQARVTGVALVGQLPDSSTASAIPPAGEEPDFNDGSL